MSLTERDIEVIASLIVQIVAIALKADHTGNHDNLDRDIEEVIAEAREEVRTSGTD